MITDLFSHKIHSSGDDWPDKLVELAFLFFEFDGRLYDRAAIETRLSNISPRSSYVARDRSKFRDEISAYPAYLGLFKFHLSAQGWVLHLSETARRFLIQEEPDVQSFMRLQLSLFQYPNGMGAAYKSGTNQVRLQANSRDRTLELIEAGVHLCPLRLVVKALIADSNLRDVDLDQSFVSYEEIFALANARPTNQAACPASTRVNNTLEQVREGRIDPPDRFERRFHILRHTGLFHFQNHGISPRVAVNAADRAILLDQLRTIASITNQFNGFDQARTGEDLKRLVERGTWGNYFDAVLTLSPEQVSLLASDLIPSANPFPMEVLPEVHEGGARPPAMGPAAPAIFDLEDRGDEVPVPAAYNRTAELADPELTRIKRQRRNLEHKRLVDLMYARLRNLGASPKDNPHIDLYAEIPDDGSFLFEMKSEGESILSQIRKGLSQLYEYRFRYREIINHEAALCIVLPRYPVEEPWLEQYLCTDRSICLCWFDDQGRLHVPATCQDRMGRLLADVAA